MYIGLLGLCILLWNTGHKIGCSIGLFFGIYYINIIVYVRSVCPILVLAVIISTRRELLGERAVYLYSFFIS